MKSESMKIVFLHILISAENNDTKTVNTENTENRLLYSAETGRIRKEETLWIKVLFAE